MNSISIALGTMTVAAAGMLLMTGERWHSHFSSRPDTLSGLDGPGIMAVLQDRDCPDARARTNRFLELAARSGVPVESVVVSGGRVGLPEFMRRRELHRAVLRAGLETTPALLLLDQEGVVRFAHSVGSETTDEEIHAALETFRSVLGLVIADATDPPGFEPGEPDPPESAGPGFPASPAPREGG